MKIQHTRQRENKLIYLFYWVEEAGFPIEEIYTRKIKEIPTERFEGLLNSELSCSENNDNIIDKKRKLSENKGIIDFSSIIKSFSQDTSYEPIAQGKPLKITKPELVNTLDFENLSQFRESDIEENSKNMSISKLEALENFRSLKGTPEFSQTKSKNKSQKMIPSFIIPEVELEINLIEEN